jgi:hypothetical protein
MTDLRTRAKSSHISNESLTKQAENSSRKERGEGLISRAKFACQKARKKPSSNTKRAQFLVPSI